MEQTFMKERKILPLVLSMSLPMVISMAVNSLYNIVDSYFVARLSEDAMTALSLVFPVQNLINAAAIGFGIGINAVVAFFLQWGIYSMVGKLIIQSNGLSLLTILPYERMIRYILPVFCGTGFIIGAGGSVLAIRKFLQV